MPAEQGLRPDQEDPPPRARKDPVRRRQEHSIALLEFWPVDLPAQDRKLMTQDHDLELLEAPGTKPQYDDLKNMPHDQIDDRHHHNQNLRTISKAQTLETRAYS